MLSTQVVCGSTSPNRLFDYRTINTFCILELVRDYLTEIIFVLKKNGELKRYVEHTSYRITEYKFSNFNEIQSSSLSVNEREYHRSTVDKRYNQVVDQLP